MRRVVFLLALLLSFVPTARANPLAGGDAPPPASPFEGTFDGPDLELTLAPAAGGGLAGTMTFKGAPYQVTGRAEGERFAGEFRGPDGKGYPLAVALDGPDGATLESGGRTYALARKPADTFDLNAPPPQPPRPPVNNAGGKPGGIGVVLNPRNFDGTVGGVMPGGPAERAGIGAGSKITSVDGRPIAGLSLDQVGQLLRGPVGSKVRVGVDLGGGAESINELVRVEVSAAPPQPPQPPNGVNNNGGMGNLPQGKPYSDPAGRWHVTVPVTWQAQQDANGMKWDGGQGLTAFAQTLGPVPPGTTAEAFAKQNVMPGLQQSGAMIGDARVVPANLIGVEGFGIQFVRMRGNQPEGGFYLASVVDGQGVIVAAMMPQDQVQARGMELGSIQSSVRLGRNAPQGMPNVPVQPGGPQQPNFPDVDVGGGEEDGGPMGQAPPGAPGRERA